MRYIFRVALQVFAVAAVIVLVIPASAGQAGTAGADIRKSSADRAHPGNPFIHLASHGARQQTAALPMGTIRLRVIPRIGGKTLQQPINWRLETFGRDAAGNRHEVAEVTGATPELVLPAGWYIVHVRLPDKKIKHPVQVTAGRTFDYTLVTK